MEKANGFKILQTPWQLFLVYCLITTVGVLTGTIPQNMVGAFAISMLLGEVTFFIADKTPIFNKYAGGIMGCILGGSALTFFGVLNEETVTLLRTFALQWGFMDFIVVTLIAGSVLGMNRRTIASAGLRYFIAIFGCIITCFAITSVVGILLGYGFNNTIIMIAAPILSAADATALSMIYSEAYGVNIDIFLSQLNAVGALGNIIAIFFGALSLQIAKKFPKLSGEGVLMEGVDESLDEAEINFKPTLHHLGAGMLVAFVLFIAARILSSIVPQVHYYAFMILLAIACKVLRILPREVELAANYWYKFIGANLIKAVLFCVGAALINFQILIDTITDPVVFILIFTAVASCALGAAVFGLFVKFKAIESALTAGLCMANAGGGGDIATLGAANRMELMPFAAISSRIGGAIIVVLMGFLTQILPYIPQ